MIFCCFFRGRLKFSFFIFALKTKTDVSKGCLSALLHTGAFFFVAILIPSIKETEKKRKIGNNVTHKSRIPPPWFLSTPLSCIVCWSRSRPKINWLSRKLCPIFYCKLLYKMGHYFLDTQYRRCKASVVAPNPWCLYLKKNRFVTSLDQIKCLKHTK